MAVRAYIAWTGYCIYILGQFSQPPLEEVVYQRHASTFKYALLAAEERNRADVPMGAFGNSLKRELGKNTGKFISNVVFGDKHSTPYRRVDSRHQVTMNARIAEAEARRRVEEVKKSARLEEAKLKREEARERAELDRKNQLYAIDGAVLRNIDILNSQAIPSDKTKLLQMLSELSVQLKANKWETKGDEAAIRNKYTEALLEKYNQCVRELEIMDVNEPRLEYYKNIATKAKRNKLWKKHGDWITALILMFSGILILLFLDNPLLIVPFAISIGIILFVWCLAWLFRRNSKKHKAIKPSETEAGRDSDKTPKQPVSKENLIVNEIDSIFFDLNENGRIEKKLAFIWQKYQRIVSSEIMKRKPIFSADGVLGSILFVGVNPSYNPIDDEVFISSADNQSLMYGSFYQRDDAPEYFKSLEEFSSLIGKGYTHINLLYARENDRDALLHSNSDFIREQLELTYDTIVKIAPLAIIFFSDYCRDMIFGADRWVDPATEKDGHYILRGTNIPIFFTDDITVIDDASRMALIRKLKTIIR